MRDLYLVALVILAGLAGTVVQTGPTKDPAQARASTKAVLASQQPEGPLMVLCSSVKANKCQARPEYTAAGFRVVIAFVPDPERTNLRLYFDRSMEAITNAAQDTGYTLYKYSLPWQPSAPRTYDLLADDEAAKAKRHDANSFPGVLAFRDKEGPTLAVLLVGESPTEGYNVDQLQHALDFESQLAASGDPIRLMGPCFSGTLSMLQRAFAAVPAFSKHPWIIYSGTATAGAAWEELKGSLSKNQLMDAATFLRTNDSTSQALEDFMTQRLHFADRPALLFEGGTIFANDVKDLRKQAVKDLRKPAVNDLRQKPGIEFRFPRGLSHVRQAYQKDPNLNQTASPDFTQDRRGLTLSGDPKDGPDQIPEFAPDSPVSHDAELGAMSEALQHDQLQYASVVATDTLDLLFVANYLRASVPDMRLVLLDSDLLQTIPSTDGSLQGSLVVGTYPIYEESQSWMGRQARVFSSQFEEGIYSATAALAGTDPGRLSQLRGDVIDDKGQGVFWISAIGRDALWPIALRFHSDQLMLSGADRLQSFTAAVPPRYWLTLAVALTVAVIGWVTAIVTAQKGKESPYQWCADFSLHSSRENLTGRTYYLSGIALAICSVWLSVTGCQLGFLLDAPTQNLLLGFLPVLGGLFLTALALVLSLRVLREFRAARMKASLQYATMFILPWGIFISYAAGLGHAVWPRATKEGFFFSLRALELGSGVCPTLPFLFVSLAFVLFSWTQLQRVIFAEERYAIPPDLSGDAHSDTLQNVVASLNVTLRSPLLDQPVTALWSSVVAFAFALFFGVRCLRSLEGQAFDYAFAFAVAALCFALVLVVLRFWNSWRRLQALMEQLELHSIRDAFGYLPEGCTWSPIWQQNPRKRNYQLLTYSLESLEAISKLPGTPVLDLEKIRKPAREVLDCVAQGSREKLATYQELQNELSVAAKALTPVLDTAMRAQVESFFALRFLSYIRYVMLHLRNLATFVTFGYVLLALALGSYPFLAPRAIAWFLSLLLIGLSIPVVLVFLQMSRDTILSKLSATTPGKADWGFATRTLSFTALPLLSMLASHFPFIGRYVFSWLQPALKSLH